MSRIRVLASMLPLFLFVVAGQAARAQEAAPGPAPQEAIDAGNAFLSLIDHGQYDESWNGAAMAIKDGITKVEWNTLMSVNRRRFGNLISRRLVSSQAVTSLPGSPDGRYVILNYKSSFSVKKAAAETVTVTSENGRWLGYQYTIKMAGKGR